MYIEPNTTIKLYSGIPFDNTYEHTLWFDDIVAQNTYFHGGTHAGRAKYTLANNSYQRVEKGKMRIALCADDIYDCNYLAFQNSNYGNKWFYAFIISVEYVNNVTSEVVFEIDSIQTYLFDMTLEECFVEREHSETDEIGDNILPEPIDCGDNVCGDTFKTGWFDKYCVIVNISRSSDGQGGYIHGGLIGGLAQGMSPICFKIDGNNDTETEQNVQTFLHYLDTVVVANSKDEIVSICMFPWNYAVLSTDKRPKHTAIQQFSINKKIGNYTPKNKKLLTYPYNYLDVDCGNNHALYRYEWFDDCEHIDFDSVGVVSANPQIALIPKNYNGNSFASGNYTEKLIMDDFPQVGYSVDSFKQWIAEHASSTALQGIGGVGAVTGAVMTTIGAVSAGAKASTVGAAIFAGVAGSLGVANASNSAMLARNLPNQERGTNSGNVDCADRQKNFYFRRMQVTEQQAKVLDDYFSMFGYACNRVKVPNRTVRLHWNYVKTNGCNIIGSAPADEIRKVAKIYDRGITFWKSPLGIGQYHNLDGTLIDNPPAVG